MMTGWRSVRRCVLPIGVLFALASGSCGGGAVTRPGGSSGGSPGAPAPDGGSGDRSVAGSGGVAGVAGAGGSFAGTGGAGTGGAASGGANGAGGLDLGGGTGGRGAGGAGSGGTASGGRGGGGGGAGAGSGGAGAGGNGAGGGGVVAAGVRWLGRVALADPTRPRFAWSGTGFVARFTGGSVAVRLNNADAFVFKAVVDGVAQPAFAAARGDGTYTLASGLSPAVHTLAIYRQTEGVYGDSELLGVTVTGGALMDPPPPVGRLIEVVGASVSCGYGDLGTSPCGFSYATESHYDAYESVAARALGAELEVVAISGRGMYRNSDGTTANTMPMLYTRALAGSATPAWDFRATPDVVVINLGKNDFGVGDPGTAFVDAYVSFAAMLRQRFARALIVCATGPNLGADNHARQVNYVNTVIATRQRAGDSNIVLLDWSEQTASQTGCDDHPTAAKQQQMGMALADLLRSRLQW